MKIIVNKMYRRCLHTTIITAAFHFFENFGTKATKVVLQV